MSVIVSGVEQHGAPHDVEVSGGLVMKVGGGPKVLVGWRQTTLEGADFVTREVARLEVVGWVSSCSGTREIVRVALVQVVVQVYLPTA